MQSRHEAVPVRLCGDNNDRIPGIESRINELGKAFEKTLIIGIELRLMMSVTLILLRGRFGDGHIGSCGELMAIKSAACKPFTPKDNVYSSQKLTRCIGFDNEAPSAQPKGFLHQLRGRFLAYEYYFGSRRKLRDLPGGCHSIQLGKADVQQDQVWLQLLSFLNRLPSVRCFQTNESVRRVLQG
jgi:hypothetical protein